jgi:general secretion pathway protein K
VSARRARGVALLTALLVVALAGVLLATQLDQGGLALARTANVQRGAQAAALAQGLEDWAVQILRRDLAIDGVDSAGDLWAQPLPPTPVPGGRIGGRLRDLGGCFNLNNLARDGVADADRVEQFRRLLRALRLDPGIADAAADWVDRDLQPAALRGAEDSAYLAARPPYRAANRPFAHVSELRLLRGVDAKAWRLLRPQVCALPGTGPTKLNVNTASVAVLQSLSERIDEGAARRLAQEGGARYASLEAVDRALDEAGVVDAGERQVLLRLLDVRSQYFAARADIELDAIPFTFGSVIERVDTRRIAVVARGRGAW